MGEAWAVESIETAYGDEIGAMVEDGSVRLLVDGPCHLSPADVDELLQLLERLKALAAQ